MNAAPLYIWTIYDHPTDQPAGFAVRLFAVSGESGEPRALEVKLAPSLEEARRLVPRDRVNIARHPSDDPCIVESWI